MREMIEAAKVRLAKIEQETETLRKFLDSAEAAAAILGGGGRGDSPPVPPTDSLRKESEEAPEGAKRTRVTDNPKAEVLIPAVKEVLRANGKPMTRRQLHAALSRRGLEVRGTDPVKTLGTILWRANDQIKSIEGWGYWPMEDEFDPMIADLLG
jgi:hypothetical protein